MQRYNKRGRKIATSLIKIGNVNHSNLYSLYQISQTISLRTSKDSTPRAGLKQKDTQSPKRHFICYFSNNLPCRLSTQTAPNGAVIKIDKTATVNTTFPHSNPMDNGIAPIAACTVAFGV